jgi:hypothetical protein
MKQFRIYGDNIVECFRFLDLFSANTIKPTKFNVSYNNYSALIAADENNDYFFELLPGFGKNDKKRWKESVISMFQKSSSLLDETPDAFITSLSGDKETLILAIEFCSALQAGNQAWQRSGRAYSIGKVGIPFLYIIDFTKYELNPETRERKALRFPNLAVPLSYNAYTKQTNNLVMETYTRSEEFNPLDPKIKDKGFESTFGGSDLNNYIYSLMDEKDPSSYENNLIEKNEKMVQLLAPSDSADSITRENLDFIDYDDLIGFIDKYCNFHAQKKIEEKSTDSKEIIEINDFLGKHSDGIFSSDLPFCLLDSESIPEFVSILIKNYSPSATIINEILSQKHLVVTLLKGFKPRGDDNRPDRGVLPLIRMIMGENIQVITILYGPVIKSSFDLFKTDTNKLAAKNGFWKTLINFSEYILVDSPIIKDDSKGVPSLNEKKIIRTNRKSEMKIDFPLSFKKLDVSPVSLREDDVDGLILTGFRFHSTNAFSGLCNPPGGDWSGLSLIKDDIVYRWLSLPRVSENSFKRPDHVIQFIEQNSLLIIESKDYLSNLENDIGTRLIGYVRWLMKFSPSVQSEKGAWTISTNILQEKDFNFITAGAFMGSEDDDLSTSIEYSNVDLILCFIPKNGKWNLRIHYKESSKVIAILQELEKAFTEQTIISSVFLEKHSLTKK